MPSSQECKYCGAALPATAPTAGGATAPETVYCSYCRRPAPVQENNTLHRSGQPAGDDGRSRASLVARVALVAATAALGVGVYVLSSRTEDDESSSPSAEAADTKPSTPSLATPQPSALEDEEDESRQGEAPASATTRYYIDEHLLRVDLDGDGELDLVLRVSDGERSRFVGLHGFEDRQLWRTSSVKGGRANAAVTGSGAVFTWEDKGTRLTAYIEGKEAWTSPMGELIERVCASDKPHHAIVKLMDERLQLVDERTGAQSSANRAGEGACRSLPMLGPSSRPIVRDELQVSSAGLVPEAFEGAISCSSGITITPAGMKRERNPCPLKLGRARQKGFGIRAIFPLETGNKWVLLGSRRPGTEVPMVGVGGAGRIDWAREVPKVDPTSSGTGMPKGYAVLGDLLVVADMARGRNAKLVAFAIANGEPIWEIELPSERLPAVYPFGDQVMAVQTSQLIWVDRNGKVTRKAGRELTALDLTEPGEE